MEQNMAKIRIIRVKSGGFDLSHFGKLHKTHLMSDRDEKKWNGKLTQNSRTFMLAWISDFEVKDLSRPKRSCLAREKQTEAIISTEKTILSTEEQVQGNLQPFDRKHLCFDRYRDPEPIISTEREAVSSERDFWKFRLGGERFRYSRQDLLRVFALPDVEIFPYVRKTVMNDFWKLISGTKSDYVPAQSATQIVSPMWKFVHRFIATCIHLRKDEGRWVSKTDLKLMCCFHNRIRFDALTIITESLEEASFPSLQGTYLGGGHLITLLAKDAGFSVDPDYAMPARFLGEEELIRRGFIKVVRFRNRGFRRYLVGRDTIPEGRTSRGSSSRDPTNPPSARDAPKDSPTLDGLATLTTYTRSGFEWQGDMFQELFTRLGCEGYTPPPPFPSWHGNTSGTRGNDEEVAASEDDDDADDMDEDDDASATF